jgi:hypothetical protein
MSKYEGILGAFSSAAQGGQILETAPYIVAPLTKINMRQPSN